MAGRPCSAARLFTRLPARRWWEGRTSFLKKSSKKLLILYASAFPGGLGADLQKSFGSFFQKRTAFLEYRDCTQERTLDFFLNGPRRTQPNGACPRSGIIILQRGRSIVGTILLVILILLLLGALPTWPYSTGWGYYPSGGLGLVLVIIIVLVLMGRI
jgi:hypothetical protein